ncbi:MAG TPA: hypothetical protein VGI21_00975 [Streptosporangiaceae bacterium]
MRRIALLLTVLAGVALAGLLTGCARAPASRVSVPVILDARTVAAGAQLPAPLPRTATGSICAISAVFTFRHFVRLSTVAPRPLGAALTLS